jgi:hypothetical protein
MKKNTGRIQQTDKSAGNRTTLEDKSNLHLIPGKKIEAIAESILNLNYSLESYDSDGERRSQGGYYSKHSHARNYYTPYHPTPPHSITQHPPHSEDQKAQERMLTNPTHIHRDTSQSPSMHTNPPLNIISHNDIYRIKEQISQTLHTHTHPHFRPQNTNTHNYSNTGAISGCSHTGFDQYTFNSTSTPGAPIPQNSSSNVYVASIGGMKEREKDDECEIEGRSVFESDRIDRSDRIAPVPAPPSGPRRIERGRIKIRDAPIKRVKLRGNSGPGSFIGLSAISGGASCVSGGSAGGNLSVLSGGSGLLNISCNSSVTPSAPCSERKKLKSFRNKLYNKNNVS